MGKLYKHYNDYTEQNILSALDRAPITGHLIPKHYIEDDVTYETCLLYTSELPTILRV